jgi:hypothetical protein
MPATCGPTSCRGGCGSVPFANRRRKRASHEADVAQQVIIELLQREDGSALASAEPPDKRREG